MEIKLNSQAGRESASALEQVQANEPAPDAVSTDVDVAGVYTDVMMIKPKNAKVALLALVVLVVGIAISVWR